MNDYQPDIEVTNGGSVVLLTPKTGTGRDWIDDNLDTEGWQWMGASLALDHRYAPPIIEGMIGDGLTIGARRSVGGAT
jgi:hypothetical protein